MAAVCASSTTSMPLSPDRRLEQRRGARIELALHQARHDVQQRRLAAAPGEAVGRLDAQQPAADDDHGRARPRPLHGRHVLADRGT